MSDQVDSGQESQEADDLASQEPSQTSDDSKLDSLAGAELAQAVRDDPAAMAELRPDFQSEKDRGVASANKAAQEALSMVGELADYLNLKPEAVREAQRSMVIDRLIDSNLQADSKPVVSEQPVTETRPEASSINYDDAYKKIGVDPPATEEELDWAFGFKNRTALENALLRKKAGQPIKPASPGTAISPGGGQTPAEVDEDALNAEFDSLTGRPMDMLLDSGKTVRERRAEIAKLVG